ncbi:MAG TPA: DUF6084 family protein [Candidatus Baltobacteraceae bacterium]|jgi:hypothetical protein
MSELSFEIVGARAERYAASPTIALRLRVREGSGSEVSCLALRVQVQIEPRRRHYGKPEEERLVELFGEPARWGETLRTVVWTHVSIVLPTFTGETEIDLLLPCSYDFDVSANKYLQALEDGEIPVTLLFSGTIFQRAPAGFSAEMVPWEKEATYRIPVQAFREAIDAHFPNAAWIRVRRDTFDELYRYKTGAMLPGWDDAIASLLDRAKEQL